MMRRLIPGRSTGAGSALRMGQRGAVSSNATLCTGSSAAASPFVPSLPVVPRGAAFDSLKNQFVGLVPKGALLLRKGKGDSSKGTKKKDDDDDGDEDEENHGEPNLIMHRSFLGIIGIAGVSGLLYYFARPTGTHVTWGELEKEAELIDVVYMYDRYIQFYLSDGRIAHVGTTPSEFRTDVHLEAIQQKREKRFSIVYVGRGWCESGLHTIGLFAWAVPFLFFPTFALVLMRGMSSIVSSQMAGMEKTGSKLTKAKAFKVARKTEVRFTDIAGLHEAKNEITEVVEFLRNPEPFQKLGAKIPTGALLLGPPGTGKTLMAKAVAGEADVSFVATTGSDFVELYVGMGALRIRQLFELARAENNANRTCIIYIDEIDAVGLKRRGAGHGEKQEQEHTLNELLTQMDGFKSNEGRILVLASSNVPQDQLDPALIRPGRFDRIIHVDAPVVAERKEIFAVHMKKLKLQKDLPAPEGEEKESGGKPTDEGESPPESESSVDKTAKKADEENTGEAKKEGEQKDTSSKIEKSTTETVSEQPKKEAPVESTEQRDIAEASPPAPKEEESVEKTATTETEKEKTGDGYLMIQKDDNADEASAATAETEAEKEKEITSKEREKEKEEIVVQYSDRMSDLCPGFVGADISNVCNEAAILAARESADHVFLSHLERSIDRVLAGIEMRSRVLSDFEKKVVAHHEAGHAVAGWFLSRADPLMKVSIVPRGGKALGYAQYLPDENNLKSTNDLLESMCVTLGGRVAEKIFFDHLSTGASDDLMKVTRMAYQMVASSAEGGTAHVPPSVHTTPYAKPFGAKLSDKFDVAAKKLVDSAYQRTHDLLLAHKADMLKLAEHLLKHEVLTHQEVLDYLGPRPQKKTDFKLV